MFPEVGPAGNSLFIPTGPAPNAADLIKNDPFHKQDLEWIEGDAAKALARNAQDKALAEQLYQLKKQQASASANAGGDYGMAGAQAQAGLARESAAHEDKLQEEQIREIMASRGMFDSGQKQFEQQERQYGLDQLLKGIEVDLQSRASAASSARSDAQRGLALQLQEMELHYLDSQRGYGEYAEDVTTGAARDRGGALRNAHGRLVDSGALNAPGMTAYWDSSIGLYKDSAGNYYNEFRQKVPGPGAGGGGGVPAPAPGPPWNPTMPVNDYAPSRPTYNPVGGKTYGI